MTGTDAFVAQPRQPRRARRFLAGLFWLLACLGILGSTVFVWVHQVALNTDAYVRVMTTVMADPEVITETSAAAADRVVTALGVEQRIANILPGQADFIAAPVADALSTRIAARLAELMATPRFQQVWADANRFVHEQAIKVLRGGSDIVSTQGGVVTLNVFPLIDELLRQLQTAGFIPPEVVLPDLSTNEEPSALRQKLQAALTALGVTLPEDFGSITLIESSKLATVQQAVRIFDVATVGIVLLTIVFAVVAVWLSTRRRRMVLWLGIGAVLALILARVVLRAGVDQLAGVVGSGHAALAIGDVLHDLLDDLFRVMLVVTFLGVALAFVAYLLGRPRWVDDTATALRNTTGEPAPGAPAPQAASAEGSTGAAGATTDAATEAAMDAVAAANASASTVSLRDEAAQHASLLRWAGVAVIALLIIWRVAGLDIALLAAAGLGVWFLFIQFVSRPRSEAEESSPEAGTQMPAAPSPEG